MKLSEILKTEGIITVSPEDTLSHAIGQLSSSHDAAFVVDDNENLLGVINPYHCLINNSYPGNAKVLHCLMKPPKVYLDTNISEVARLMGESKIHYLPIYDEKKKFVGIISARRILLHLLKLPESNRPLRYILRSNRTLKAVMDDEKISKALHFFKESKISKLIVLNKDNKLKGVLTFYDLISHLATPKVREGSGDRKGVKTPFLNYQVKNFMKTMVLTMSDEASIADAIKLILDRKIGSIVIVDKENHPYDIVTTRDIFNTVFKKQSSVNFEVMTKNLSTVSKLAMPVFNNKFFQLISRRKNIRKATLFVEQKSKGMFKVLFSLIPKKGKREYIEREGRDLTDVLSEVKKTAKEIQGKEK